MTVLSLENLIKEKVKIKQSDDKVIETSLLIPRLGGSVKLSFTKSDVRDFLEVTNNVEGTKKEKEEKVEAAGLNLIYSIISEPNLKDKELQKVYECKEPTDIVKGVFNDGEMSDIVSFATKKAGFVGGSVVEVEEVKN